MKKIGMEEHFFTSEHLDYLRSRTDYPRLESAEDENGKPADRLLRMPGSSQLIPRELMERLLDLGPGRLAAMDRAGIAMQVLSMAGPGVEEFDAATGAALARNVNDELAENVKRHPDRFAGLATIAYGDPRGAARELERAVTKLGFKGAKLNSHLAGEYLDDRKYWPIFEAAEALGVPLMLHPKDPPPGLLNLLSAYPGLTQAAWGFALDASSHALRLICSGLFDAHPRLRILLGHLGEGIPFWLSRIDNHWTRAPQTVSLRRKPSEYFRENFLITTSGMFWDPQFQCVCQIMGTDSIMFAADYPYESMEQAVRFIDAAPLGAAEREKICHSNAERQLGLQ